MTPRAAKAASSAVVEGSGTAVMLTEADNERQAEPSLSAAKGPPYEDEMLTWYCPAGRVLI
jgi:predicted secreted protein